MLALTGGSASFTPSVSSYTPDLVSSAKAGADMARDIHRMNALAVKQAQADIEKTEAETDAIKTRRYDKPMSNVIEGLINRIKGVTSSNVTNSSQDSTFFDGLDELVKDVYSFMNPVGASIVFGGNKSVKPSSYKMPTPKRGGRNHHKYRDAFRNSTSYHYD
jgi:hypothetical protein